MSPGSVGALPPAEPTPADALSPDGGDRAARLRGAALGAGAAAAYAVTIVIGRQLASAGVGSGISLGIRFGIGAAFLAAVLAAARRPLLPAPGERLAAFLLGAVGYAVEATLFYLALSKGTAGAVTLLFYAYPSLVAVIEAVRDRRLPPPRIAVALVMSAAGITLIVLAAGRVQISATGVVLSLSGAAAFALYLMAGDRLMTRTDPPTTALWVAFGASLSLLARAVVLGRLAIPASAAPRMVVYGVATGVAFVCMFAALRLLGGSRTAVVMTLEALFAVVLGALLLDERVGPATAVGGLAVLVAAVLVSTAPRPDEAAREPLPRE